MDESGIAQTMRIPFSFTEDELRQPFGNIEFSRLQVKKQEQDLYLKDYDSKIPLDPSNPLNSRA